MRPEYEVRWLAVAEHEPLKHPHDLIARRLSNEDYIDSAMVGGATVADIIAGDISERQIPPSVLQAYHLQYPHGNGFVEAVRNLHGDPAALRGLLSGVRGKLFEMDFVDRLNHGGLPNGWSAELAPQANQPGWDILIRDEHGALQQELQLKATNSVEYVREALERYPHIDIAVTHELYAQLAADPILGPLLIDGHDHLTTLMHVVEVSADQASIHFGWLPVELALGFTAVQSFTAYRGKRRTLKDALANLGVRGILLFAARGAAYGAALATAEPLVGLPVSITVRLLGGQLLHNLEKRKKMRESLSDMDKSINELSTLSSRRVFVAFES